MMADRNELAHGEASAGYVCLPRQIFERDNYALQPVAPCDIEHIRVWRNAQMDVLRQTKPISTTEQEKYFATHIWPAMAEQTPAHILLSLFEDGARRATLAKPAYVRLATESVVGLVQLTDDFGRRKLHLQTPTNRIHRFHRDFRHCTPPTF